MAQRTLNAFVVIGGRVDNSFGQIGTALINLGSTVDEISSKLLNFGKESLNVYKDFELSMADAEIALATKYGQGTQKLAKVMDGLKNASAEWAASTIFHTNDVANAITEAARGGWDYEQILEGIPAVMHLAEAGGLDLSEALQYVLQTTNALQLPFEELNELIDEWTFAANSSVGNVRTFGEAMRKMGSTMQFAESKEELLALIGVMHDMGAEGTEAGTLLRNSMIRLLAPSGVASKILSQLGATDEEIKGVMQDASKLKALNELERAGFSAFDDQGNAKSVLEIYGNLGDILADMAGGWDNISKNEKTLGVLSNVFGVRAQTGALNIVKGLKEASELYGRLTNGDAEGYGAFASELRMDTLYGKTELLLSKVEDLKRIVGENLKPDIESISGWAGGVIDSIAGLDPKIIEGLTSGLEVLAVAGGTTIAAGSVLRFIGMLANPTSAMFMGAIALASIARSINTIQNAEFKDAFGDMDIDTTALTAFLGTLDSNFQKSTEKITAFKDALNDSITKYKEASTTFSTTALTDMLTGKELTDDDLAYYQGLGETMVKEIKKGITASADMSAEFWAAFFKKPGEEGTEYAQNPIFQGLIQALSDEKGEAISEAEAIGEELQKAIMDAFGDDGKISEPEYAKIKGYFRDLNQKMAEAQREAQSEADFIARKQLMDKAQNMSYDAMMDFIGKEIEPQRQNELDYWTQNFNAQKYRLEYRYLSDWEKAQTDAERKAVDELYNGTYGAALHAENGKITFDALDAELQRKQAEVYSQYDQMILDMMTVALGESDFADADAYWTGLIQQGLSPQEAKNAVRNSKYGQSKGIFGTIAEGLGVAGLDSDMNKLEQYYSSMIEKLGGSAEILRRVGMYRSVGNEPMAQQLELLMNKSGYLNNSFTYSSIPQPGTIMDVPIEPIEQSVTFPDAVSNAKAAHDGMAAEFTDITQTVTIEVIPSTGADGVPVGGVYGGGNGIDAPRYKLSAEARGGRETRPAIFAEAGIPEWFIPEEHSENSLGLVAGALTGSGFSLVDLARFMGADFFADGGTTGSGTLDWGDVADSGSSGTSFQVQYSPVIHADNADGVAQVLKEDKKRIKKILRELMDEKELYESVVAYR